MVLQANCLAGFNVAWSPGIKISLVLAVKAGTYFSGELLQKAGWCQEDLRSM
jgi:hypothetical protein